MIFQHIGRLSAEGTTALLSVRGIGLPLVGLDGKLEVVAGAVASRVRDKVEPLFAQVGLSLTVLEDTAAQLRERAQDPTDGCEKLAQHLLDIIQQHRVWVMTPLQSIVSIRNILPTSQTHTKWPDADFLCEIASNLARFTNSLRRCRAELFSELCSRGTSNPITPAMMAFVTNQLRAELYESREESLRFDPRISRYQETAALLTQVVATKEENEFYVELDKALKQQRLEHVLRLHQQHRQLESWRAVVAPSIGGSTHSGPLTPTGVEAPSEPKGFHINKEMLPVGDYDPTDELSSVAPSYHTRASTMRHGTGDETDAQFSPVSMATAMTNNERAKEARRLKRMLIQLDLEDLGTGGPAN